jgi:hypothetical protein
MTLLTTEIHNHNSPDRAVIVFAADRRLSYHNGTYAGTRRKIFKLPRPLNGGIGYFGLAGIRREGRVITMDQWLEPFLRHHAGAQSLEEFAFKLAAALNAEVRRAGRKSAEGVSGFHIAGFNSQGHPEFWYVRNVDDDRITPLGEHQVREDFQSRDAPTLQPGAYWIYRNGDIRAHVVTWQAIDKSLGSLLGTPDFKPLTTPEEYVAWVKFKMELVAYFYKNYCKSSIIGKPVDTFAIIPRH